jgi:hypothetical protein
LPAWCRRRNGDEESELTLNLSLLYCCSVGVILLTPIKLPPLIEYVKHSIIATGTHVDLYVSATGLHAYLYNYVETAAPVN